jgi:hypothetical protein
MEQIEFYLREVSGLIAALPAARLKGLVQSGNVGGPGWCWTRRK